MAQKQILLAQTPRERSSGRVDPDKAHPPSKPPSPSDEARRIKPTHYRTSRFSHRGSKGRGAAAVSGVVPEAATAVLTLPGPSCGEGLRSANLCLEVQWSAVVLEKSRTDSCAVRLFSNPCTLYPKFLVVRGSACLLRDPPHPPSIGARSASAATVGRCLTPREATAP